METTDAMEKPEWSKGDVEALITKYKSYPSLWDTQSEDYRNKSRKRDAWNALAFEFNTTEAEVQRKIHNLRNQFSQELKKPGKRKPGQMEVTPYRSKWPHFQALQFIRGLVVGRRSTRRRSRVIERDIKEEISIGDSDVEGETVENGHQEEAHHLEWERTTTQPQQQTTTLQVRNKAKRIRRHELVNGHELVNDSAVLKKARPLLGHEPDQYDTFGAFVACEIRSLQYNSNKIKLKRIIQNAILDVAESEEEQLEQNNYNGSFQIPAVTYTS